MSVLSESIIREGSVAVPRQIAYQHLSGHTECHMRRVRYRINDSLNSAITKVMSIQARIQLWVYTHNRTYFHVINANAKSFDGTIGVQNRSKFFRHGKTTHCVSAYSADPTF